MGRMGVLSPGFVEGGWSTAGVPLGRIKKSWFKQGISPQWMLQVAPHMRIWIGKSHFWGSSWSCLRNIKMLSFWIGDSHWNTTLFGTKRHRTCGFEQGFSFWGSSRIWWETLTYSAKNEWERSTARAHLSENFTQRLVHKNMLKN